MINSRGSFWDSIPPVTKNLIIINLIVWFFMFVSAPLASKLLKFGALHYIGASDFNVAQFFTYMFMHDTNGPMHILFNMFTLYMFGRTIEQVVGSKKFLFFYLSCGIGAALIQELTWFLSFDSIIGSAYGIPASQVSEAIVNGYLADFQSAKNYIMLTVGASGAIYGVLLAFAMLFPNMPLYLMFIPIPVKAKWMVIGFIVIEICLGMANAHDGIAHFAHLGGMIFGLLIILYWRKKGIIHGPLY